MTHYRKFDRLLLWGLLAPLLFYTAWTKWAVVHANTPLSGWALADFLRLHAGYYGLILLWAACLLRDGPRPWGWRLAVLLLTVYFVAADMAYSFTIHYTGALAPFDVAYYMGKAIDRLTLPIPATEWLTLALMPLLFLTLALLKWRQQRPNLRASHIAPMALAALMALLVPPLSDRLELNTARPSYAYQIVEFLRSRSLFAPAMANEAAPATPATIQPATLTRRPRNLVVIALESVGARATGLYNPARAGVTPFLDELARSSWVAEQAYTVTPHTSKALVAINCAQQPYPRHPIFESTYGLDAPCLAHLLRQQGYRTAFFQSPTEHFENRRSLVKHLGFEDFVPGDNLDSSGLQLASYFGYEDNILLAPSRDWLRQQTQPFFAFYLTGTTHHPYWVPDRYGMHAFEPSDPEHNRYLNAVHYLDHFLRNLITQYRELGLYEDSLFVIVGDHGESLGEHSRRQHNASLYQEVMQVPLLIHAPGQPVRGRGRLASQLDILPSALALLGFHVQGGEGLALVGSGQERATVRSGCWYDNWCLALTDGHLKYIHNFNQKPDELYDLHRDPQERINLAAQQPETVARWQQELLDRHQRQLLRWHHFLAGQDEDYWDNRGSTLGAPATLLQLAQDDPRRQTTATP